MRRVSVVAFSQACAVTPSVVDFDPRHEVILLCSDAGRSEAAGLAETLLAEGFDAVVFSGTPPEIASALDGHAQGSRPALLVATGPNCGGAVLRSRVARALSRPHCWLEADPARSARELQHEICARMDGFEREHAEDPRVEPVVVEEVSNVLLLPVVPRHAPVRAQPAKTLSRIQLVAWPLLGAGLTALGLVLLGKPASEPPLPPDPPQAAATPAAALASPPVHVEPAPPVPEAHAAVKPKAGLPAAVPPPPPVVPPEPSESALDNEHVAATDAWLVYEAPARPRDWFAAMDLCKGRTLAGSDGWSTPSSKQLHALAKARVLPDGALWSRTRALRADDVAFVVHGRAGTVRSAIKTETIDAAVCVRRRSPSP